MAEVINGLRRVSICYPEPMSEREDAKTILPGRAAGSVRVPGSKSLTLRALACASLAKGRSRVSNALFSRDALGLAAAFRRLGARIDEDPENRSFEIEGTGGPPSVDRASLDVADCGTCMRFLVAIAATGRGTFELDGTARMRERPIGGLVEALRGARVDVDWLGSPGRPPVRVRAAGLGSGEIEVDAGESSQYVSALLIAATTAEGPVTIRPIGAVPSRPYVDLTVDCLRSFGGQIDVREDAHGSPSYEVRPSTLAGGGFAVEGDFSSASYFFAAAAVTGGTVEVRGVRADSRQGDRRFLDFLRALGHRVEATPEGVRVVGMEPASGGSSPGTSTTEVEFDFGDCPDVVPTAAVVAALGNARVAITGAPHLRIKESDRIATVCTELARLGAGVEERDDGMILHGGRELRGADVETYEDHRIAMAFAIAGLRVPGVRILDPECTSKSYPEFFDDLARIQESGTLR